MIIDLKSYDDLGKCTWLTLSENFDTSRDHIYLAVFNYDAKLTKCEIPIETLDDLKPFLWANPFVSFCNIDENNQVEHHYIFAELHPEPWWKRYGIIIEDYEQDAEEIYNRIKRDNGCTKKQ